MTLVMMVMGLAPLIAPSRGGLVLLFGSWWWIFVLLLAITLGTAVLFLRSVPETLAVAHRQPRLLAKLGSIGGCSAMAGPWAIWPPPRPASPA